MSLDLYLSIPACECCGREQSNVFECNVTHNLTPMADLAGIYKAMWRPEEISPTCSAEDIIGPMEKGLRWLITNEEEARKLNPENGWGSYDGFVEVVMEYIQALRRYPKATVIASR